MSLPRIVFISFAETFNRSTGAVSFFENNILPLIFACWGSNCNSDKAVTDLPEPDSPTIAIISPVATSNEISFTAFVTMPSAIKSIDKFCTCKRGLAMEGKIKK